MSAKDLHIVFLPAWYPHKQDAMFGLFVRKHAQAVAMQHSVSVLYLHANKPETTTCIEHNTHNNLSEWHIYYPKSKNPLVYLWRFVSLFFKGMRLINKNQQAKLIHVHILSRMGVLACLYNCLHGTAYLITEHWSRYLPNVGTYKGFWRKRLTEISVKRASAVLPVSLNLAQAMQQNGLLNKYYQVVNNVVDDVFFETKTTDKARTKIRAIHVSTFEDKSKNISGILRNIAQIAKTRQNFEVFFVGTGMDFKSMYTLSQRLGLLNSYVFFTGELKEADVAKEMANSDFLLMYSHYENMPVVISEAMACGLPVLASNVGGIAEHITSEYGLLCPPNDDEAFCQTFTNMLNNYKNYDADAIQQYAYRQFSYTSVSKTLSQIYEKII